MSLWCHFRALLLCGAPSLRVCRGHCVSDIAASHPLYIHGTTSDHTHCHSTLTPSHHHKTQQYPTPSHHNHTLTPLPVPHTTSSHHHIQYSSQSNASKSKLTFGRLLRKAGAVDDERECADFVRLKVCALMYTIHHFTIGVYVCMCM